MTFTLIEITTPRPVEFAQPEKDDSPIIFKSGDETHILPINKKQYEAMQLELKKNKGIDEKVEKTITTELLKSQTTESLSVPIAANLKKYLSKDDTTTRQQPSQTLPSKKPKDDIKIRY